MSTEPSTGTPLRGIRFSAFIAIRQTWREGYGLESLRHDVLAGLVVGIVALPLSMALAIAIGAPPQNGIYTAIVAGVLSALTGGSRVQISGPTAAFVVILAPIVAKEGLTGLMLATVLAGIILMLMGMARLGRLIEFIPQPVTNGFTAGIAVVIATLQLKDFFGLSIAGAMPDSYVERVRLIVTAMPTLRMPDMLIGCLTLTCLIAWPRITRRIPAPLVAITIATVVAAWAMHAWPQLGIVTIKSRFGGIPQALPSFAPPWQTGFAGGEAASAWGLIRSLVSAAFVIAMLGAIESLLSAVVADGMTGRKHDPDGELIGQGLGNIVAPFFGGFAATGAIARTATNIRYGGRSPVASVVHAVFLLLVVLLLAPVLGYLPMASLAALLLLVAYNMSEWKHCVYLIRVAPRSDVLVLLTCFLLTVLFDMVIAVSAGVVLAAILFMKRMAEVSEVKLIGDEHPIHDLPLPRSVVLYEIAGPLFFGAAQRATSALSVVDSGVRCMVLDMESVPWMDATGLMSLKEVLRNFRTSKVFVILGGVRPQPAETLARAGVCDEAGRLAIRDSFDNAVALARAWAAAAD